MQIKNYKVESKNPLNMGAVSKQFMKNNLKFDHPLICSGTWGRNFPKDSRKTTLKVEYPFIYISHYITRYKWIPSNLRSFGPPCGIIMSKDKI